jgi:hypothetical protein
LVAGQNLVFVINEQPDSVIAGERLIVNKTISLSLMMNNSAASHWPEGVVPLGSEWGMAGQRKLRKGGQAESPPVHSWSNSKHPGR